MLRSLPPVGEVDDRGKFDAGAVQQAFGQRQKFRIYADGGDVAVGCLGFGAELFNAAFGVVVVQRREVEQADEVFGGSNVIHG